MFSLPDWFVFVMIFLTVVGFVALLVVILSWGVIRKKWALKFIKNPVVVRFVNPDRSISEFVLKTYDKILKWKGQRFILNPLKVLYNKKVPEFTFVLGNASAFDAKESRFVQTITDKDGKKFDVYVHNPVDFFDDRARLDAGVFEEAVTHAVMSSPDFFKKFWQYRYIFYLVLALEIGRASCRERV